VQIMDVDLVRDGPGAESTSVARDMPALHSAPASHAVKPQWL